MQEEPLELGGGGPNAVALEDLPVGVGFGIRDAKSAQAIARIADAVVIGSRIIEEIEGSAPGEAADRVRGLLAGIRQAMDQGATS